MKNLAVFVSGGGSNFQAIIEGIKKGEINGEIKICISSTPTAYAIERAKQNDIPFAVFDKKKYKSLEVMFEDIDYLMNLHKIDYIILAGYMTIVPPAFVKKYPSRIINIHPSLIPKYSGDGYYGMRVHNAVIAGGEKESGATVHFVDEGVDTGKIIRQEKVPVYPTDTPETLAKRVLELEHKLITKAVGDLCK